MNSVYAELRIHEGDAHIIRNAGGSAYVRLSSASYSLAKPILNSKDALRSIIISQRLLGTREIAVFHHTDCGMLTFNTPQLRQIVKESDPNNEKLKVVDQIDFLEFPELEQSVIDDVQYLQENPLVLPETIITGWVYEVGSGKVRYECHPLPLVALTSVRFADSSNCLIVLTYTPSLYICISIQILCLCYFSMQRSKL